MEAYKIKQNLYGLIQAYSTPILLIAVIVVFSISQTHNENLSSWLIILILLGLTSYRYFLYINRPLQIEVDGDRIKFKTVLGKITEFTFADVQDIEINKRRELFFTINDQKIRSLNTYKNFDKFLDDAKGKNPTIKFWGFEKH